jgi:sugar-specific transcriptional regulator TrmB
MNGYSNSISPQSLKIYKLLVESSGYLTAKEIGKEIGIVPNSVYRAVNELEKHGLIERFGNRPVQIKAHKPTEVVDRLFIPYREWFLKNYSTERSQTVGIGDDLGVSFIKNRSDSIERSTKDQEYMKKELLLIVSGDEVPAETILVNKMAIERGVKIKIIVQRADKDNQEMLDNWKRLGMQVRYSTIIKTRLTIIDSRIAYIVSYDPTDKEKGLGVRFSYPPVAGLLREVFYQKWKESKRI